MAKGFLRHQEGVMDTGEKMGVVAGDGVNMVKLGSKVLANVFVLAQDSLSKVYGR